MQLNPFLPLFSLSAEASFWDKVGMTLSVFAGSRSFNVWNYFGRPETRFEDYDAGHVDTDPQPGRLGLVDYLTLGIFRFSQFLICWAIGLSEMAIGLIMFVPLILMMTGDNENERSGGVLGNLGFCLGIVLGVPAFFVAAVIYTGVSFPLKLALIVAVIVPDILAVALTCLSVPFIGCIHAWEQSSSPYRSQLTSPASASVSPECLRGSHERVMRQLGDRKRPASAAAAKMSQESQLLDLSIQERVAPVRQPPIEESRCSFVRQGFAN